MTLAQARRIALYVLAVFVLYAIVAFPERATDFAGLGFLAVSAGAESVGDLLAGLIG